MPKISIIVPIYNVEKYLDKCVNSILKQTFRDFELILVDDGSPDKCGIICDKYARKDDRVKVIHKDNGGLSSARNAGLDVAKGEYIGFIDSDDYIDCKMFEILYNIAIKDLSDIVICNFETVYEQDDTKKNYNYNSIKYTNLEALNQLYSDNTSKFVVSWNKLYNKKLFNNLRYKEGIIHEDEFIIHEILYKCNIVSYTPTKLYFYRYNNCSITNSPFNVNKLDAIYAFNERIKFFKKNKLDELRYKAEYNYINKFFSYYYRAKYELKNIDNELKQLKKDFKKNIFNILRNPMYSSREKLVWILFIISPEIYEKRYVRY